LRSAGWAAAAAAGAAFSFLFLLPSLAPRPLCFGCAASAARPPFSSSCSSLAALLSLFTGESCNCDPIFVLKTIAKLHSSFYFLPDNQITKI
jgi:hypothetical protein